MSGDVVDRMLPGIVSDKQTPGMPVAGRQPSWDGMSGIGADAWNGKRWIPEEEEDGEERIQNHPSGTRGHI